MSACNSSDSGIFGLSGATIGGGDAGSFDRCEVPNEGCDCDDEGQVIECGSVQRRSEDYITCTMGTRQCVRGAWSVCQGDHIVEREAPPSRSLQQLAPMPQACVGNPCDPYCQNYTDGADGLNLDGGLAIVDGGVSIPVSFTDGPMNTCTGLTVTPGMDGYYSFRY
jgi:hypothetical protein